MIHRFSSITRFHQRTLLSDTQQPQAVKMGDVMSVIIVHPLVAGSSKVIKPHNPGLGTRSELIILLQNYFLENHFNLFCWLLLSLLVSA